MDKNNTQTHLQIYSRIYSPIQQEKNNTPTHTLQKTNIKTTTRTVLAQSEQKDEVEKTFQIAIMVIILNI